MPRKDEYEDVGIKGIKRRIKDGKYIVSIDLGRQPKINPKTGLVEQKQGNSGREQQNQTAQKGVWCIKESVVQKSCCGL